VKLKCGFIPEGFEPGDTDLFYFHTTLIVLFDGRRGQVPNSC
jgi:hypothetical protein